MALFRRRREVEFTLRLPAVENLFIAPDLDPFSPDFELYGEKPGMDTLAGRLRGLKPTSRVRAILVLPAPAIAPDLEQRAAEAVRRYCAVKLSELGEDLRQLDRHGWRTLVVGLVAVLVLNSLSKPLQDSSDSILELIADGLQIAAWVTLWVPINLLVYDRWYSRRDLQIYRQLQRMEIAIVPEGEQPEGAARR
jgi:hypothetical protein